MPHPNQISETYERQNENPVFNYERDAYIVGDSLSVWITNGINVSKTAVEEGKTTSWMLQAIQNDIENLKTKKVMFVLGGTNDVFSHGTASEIIHNLEQMVQIGKQHGLQVVVGTIPPFSHDTKVVQDAMQKMGTTAEERSSVIRAVNAHIRSNYQHIDYYSLLIDSTDATKMQSRYEWNASARDGIHPFNAYRIMQQMQRDKMQELSIGREKGINLPIDAQNAELHNTIDSLEKSIIQFQTMVRWVFENQKMTPEQEWKMNEIVSKKQEMLTEMRKILAEIEVRKHELRLKNTELSVYQNAERNINQSDDFAEKISDLQKRILEIDEEQSIFLKDFRFLHEWIQLNQKLSPNEVENLRTMSVTNFLQMPREKRLQAVTVGNVETKEILDGTVKTVEINFSFGGRFNRALYMATTAGMIFPAEVREVVVNGEKYSRQYLEGEFFNSEGRRLIIRDETRVTIAKIEKTDDLLRQFSRSETVMNYNSLIEQEIAFESERRGISVEMAMTYILPNISHIRDEKVRNAIMENLFVDIDRKRWYFYNTTGKSANGENGKMTPEFLSFFFSENPSEFRTVAEKMWYSSKDIDMYSSFVSPREYAWSIDIHKVLSANISEAEIARIRSIKQFHPHSSDAILLFRIAAKSAWLPEEWATNKNLHRILASESNGKVGVLNYTIKGMWLDRFYQLANASSRSNPIGARSTASGLGQLLLSNVDKYYPNGRKGIGDPIAEAIGFMKYIEDRYGHPDVAGNVYGKIWSYNHPIKWQQYKWFREWY